MKIPLTETHELLKEAAGLFVPKAEAELFASLYITSHLHRWPRLNPLEEAVEDLTVWHEAGKNRTSVHIDMEKDGVVLLDFGKLAPSLKIKQVHDLLETKARACGIAAAGFHNSSGVITLLPWALGLAERDLIGLAMFNGGVNCCVPFGGTRGLFGTLPLAYAIPTNSYPILGDMAMTEIPFFQVQQAKDKEQPLPERSAVDRSGLPTTNAAEALGDDGTANLLPVGGGFKGYSLIMLLEILTGSLVGSLLSDKQTPGWHPQEYGAFIVAIDIGSFTDIGRFKNEASELSQTIRMQQPAKGIDEIPIPGDRGRKQAESLRKSGKIEIKDEILEKLRGLIP